MVTWKPFVHARSMWNMQNTIMPSSKCAYTFIDAYILISFSRCCWKFMFFIHFYFISLLQNVTYTNDGWSRNSIYFGMELVRSVLCMTVFHHPIPMARNFQTNRAISAVVAKKINKEFSHAFHAHVWKYPASKFKISWIFSKRITYAYEQQSQIIWWMLVVFSFFLLSVVRLRY